MTGKTAAFGMVSAVCLGTPPEEKKKDSTESRMFAECSSGLHAFAQELFTGAA
jgi:hypothetical protein